MFQPIYSRIKRRLAIPFRPTELSLRTIAYRDVLITAMINEDVGWRLFVDGEYERRELDAISKFALDGEIILDIGANIGIYSILLAKSAPLGTVYAFEPVPRNRAFIAFNAMINGLKNVIIEPSVVSDTVGEIEFTESEDAAYSSILDTGRKSPGKTFKIASNTLDNFVLSLGKKVSIIKIDVEGAELLVLRGGTALLTNPDLRPAAILVELNSVNQKPYGYGPAELVSFLNSMGYIANSLTPSGTEEGWPRPRASEDVLFLPKKSAP
jgi:FkbM family methyltransferase